MTSRKSTGSRDFNSLGGTLFFLKRSRAFLRLLVKKTSQLSSQETYCGRFPAYVGTSNPNLPFGEVLFWWSLEREAANFSGSGISSVISRNSHRKKAVSATDSNLPHAMGLGTNSGVTSAILLMEINSPRAMLSPSSLARIFMKKDFGEPSCSSTLILPVVAQKLTPCASVDTTLHFGGRSGGNGERYDQILHSRAWI